MSTTRQYRKRNRPVTACTECQRRKQKCDRERPCKQCTSRGVDLKCSYTCENGTQHTSDSIPEPLIDDLVPDASLANRLGYSSASTGKELLDALEQESHVDVPPILPRTYPPHQLEQISRASRRCRTLSKRLQQKYDSCIAYLPPTPIIDSLVATFNTEVDWYLTIVEWPYFDSMKRAWQDWRGQSTTSTADDFAVSAKQALNRLTSKGGTPLDFLYFPAALFQVLAFSLQFLPMNSPVRTVLDLPTPSASDKLSRLYSDMGEEVLSLLGRYDSTEMAVLADLLRCGWLKNIGFGSESWFSLADAIRQAQNLGMHLHSDIHSPHSARLNGALYAGWQQEARRRLWATVFSWESHMALMLGRSRMINTTDCTVEAPVDCDFPESPTQAFVAPLTGIDKPSTYTPAIVKLELAKLIHKVMSAGATDPNCKDYSLILGLHDEVLKIVDSLPSASRPVDPDTSWDMLVPSLKKNRLHIAIMINSKLVSLHKPHAVRFARSREVAVRASLAVLDAVQQLFELLEEHQYRIHTLTFNTLEAVIFLTTILTKQDELDMSHIQREREPPLLERVENAFFQAQDRFERARTRSGVAGFAAQTVRYCLFKLPSHGKPSSQPPKSQIGSENTSHIDRYSNNSGSNLPLSYTAEVLPIEPFPPPLMQNLAITPETRTWNGSNGSLNTSPESSNFDATGMQSRSVDGLQFDVDLQTAVWMEQIGMTETTFPETDLEELFA